VPATRLVKIRLLQQIKRQTRVEAGKRRAPRRNVVCQTIGQWVAQPLHDRVVVDENIKIIVAEGHDFMIKTTHTKQALIMYTCIQWWSRAQSSRCSARKSRPR
jgi:hypothetical protein